MTGRLDVKKGCAWYATASQRRRLRSKSGAPSNSDHPERRCNSCGSPSGQQRRADLSFDMERACLDRVRCECSGGRRAPRGEDVRALGRDRVLCAAGHAWRRGSLSLYSWSGDLFGKEAAMSRCAAEVRERSARRPVKYRARSDRVLRSSSSRCCCSSTKGSSRSMSR